MKHTLAFVGSALVVVACLSSRHSRSAAGPPRTSATSNEAVAATWPAWRGPTGQGIASPTRLPNKWPVRLEPIWTAELGEGWSSPILANDRVFVTDRTGDTERMLAWSADTGKLLWKRTRPVDFDPHA